jgi:2'-5' RNA ligase
MPSRRPRRKFGPSQKDRIFLAALPDAATASRIHALGAKLKSANGFTGTQILPEHLHITLFHLGDWAELPGAIVEAASRAAEDAAGQLAPFEVSFARSESFRNATGIYPFVLVGDASQWRGLRDALGAALMRAGLGGATKGEFKPHVTLLRDEGRAKPQPVAPIAWQVQDVVLVHSLLGRTTHIHLGRWRLGR